MSSKLDSDLLQKEQMMSKLGVELEVRCQSLNDLDDAVASLKSLRTKTPHISWKAMLEKCSPLARVLLREARDTFVVYNQASILDKACKYAEQERKDSATYIIEAVQELYREGADDE